MTPTYIIIHTAAFDGDADIAEIRRWHLARGFADVGYHWYIRRDGTLEKGRVETRQGAHCKDGGMNRKSIGICFEGHGDHEKHTVAQRATLKKLHEEIKERWDIPVQNVLGHRETGANKTCPGNLIDMHELREFLT